MRPAALVGLAVVAAACASGPPPPTGSPAFRPVEVRQPDAGPLTFTWEPEWAHGVEVRRIDTGEMVWRAAAGMDRMGTRELLRSPLPMAAFGTPPDVYPPDGRGAGASLPLPLEVGAEYAVLVMACDPLPEGGCAESSMEPPQATFVARRTFAE